MLTGEKVLEQDYKSLKVKTMDYHFSKTMDCNFETAVSKIREGLAKEGFGIVTEIDVKKLLKEKIDKDFRNYIVLGACNPNIAYQAIMAEDKIGTLIPCNVVVQEHVDGRVEVSAVDPVSYMLAFKNENLEKILSEVREKLEKIIHIL